MIRLSQVLDFFFQVCRPLATSLLVGSRSWPHWSSLRSLYSQNTGQININRGVRLGASLHHDVLKPDTNLHQRLKLVTHENRHQFAAFASWEKLATFLQNLQSGSFRFKTTLRTSLPGKYRNGVVLAFYNFAVFPGGEQCNNNNDDDNNEWTKIRIIIL